MPRGGQQARGHLGFAYGLMSGLMLDPARRCGIVYAISGTGADPEAHPGRYSRFPLWEERLQGLLWAGERLVATAGASPAKRRSRPRDQRSS